ncbi:hypothetical protein ACWD4O_39065 [Streptomyces sp. NPDC002623]
MSDFDEPMPTDDELRALALYNHLVNLSPDNGDRALMITLRMPDGRRIGDVWLSAQYVQNLIDSTIGMALLANAENRLAEAEAAAEEPTAATLPTAQHETPPGDFSAAAVAQCNPALYADVTDVFLLLDPREITRTVLDHRQVDFHTVVRALDEAFGEIADPYADEDDTA